MTTHVLPTADAEVISIDAFVREPNGVIFGVTLVKVCEKPRPILKKCSLILTYREAQTPRKSTSICMACTALHQLHFTGIRWLVSMCLTNLSLHAGMCLLYRRRGLAANHSELHPFPAYAHPVRYISSAIPLMLCMWHISDCVRILAGDHWEDVFLLSGDDLKVHMYRETQEAEVLDFYSHMTS